MTIEHGAIDATSKWAIAAASIAAERPTDAARWATDHCRAELRRHSGSTSWNTPLADAAAWPKPWPSGTACRPSNCGSFNDASSVTLERRVPEFLARIGGDARLVVYFVGHAVKGDKGQVYLAPKDFRSDKPEVNGWPLQWLVDLMEKCPAKEKLLLLDASHAGSGVEQAAEPSSAEMIASLKRQPNRAILLTVTAVASCREGEREVNLPEKGHGAFAASLAEGYGGAADVHRDTCVEPTELFDWLKKDMVAAAHGRQTPVLFRPDNRPPRLSEAAKVSIRRLAEFAGRLKIDADEVDQEYNNALQTAGAEPEPRLIYGLVLIKEGAKARDKALQHFEVLRTEMPDRLLPSVALAWLKMGKRAYVPAVNELLTLVNKIPKPSGPEASNSPEAKFLFRWAGQLREHAAGVSESSRLLDAALAALDTAVVAHGQQAADLYAKGRQTSAAVLADYDKRAAETSDEAETKKIEIDRRQLFRYADFPLNEYIRQLLAHLDD